MTELERTLLDPLKLFYQRLVDFLPVLMSAVVVLTVGILLAALIKAVVLRIFRTLKIDGFVDRSGVGELIRKGGIKDTPSILIARLIAWLVFFVFALIAMDTLQIRAAGRLFERFLLYLPHFFVSLLVLLIGYVIANFLGRAALIAAVNAGNRSAGLIGKTVTYAVIMLSVTMALEQLGIGSGTIIIAFGIVLGGVVLALSLALGLGGKDLAREYLEKRMRGNEKKDDIQHV